MGVTRVKTPDQIRMEMLVNNFGYILLRLFLFMMSLILITVVIIAKLLHIPTLSAIVWAWIYPTKFARKTRPACRFVSLNVPPLAALIGFASLGSLPIVVGATLEQDGPELKEFWLQTKAFVTPYLPIPSFFFGLIITYIVLRLLPGYDDTCSRINENLHAPQSIVELIEHKPLPGTFPIMPSRKMMDDIRDLLSTKDKEIASLQNNSQSEDQELVDLLAEKDEEITNYQTALQEKEKQIFDLHGNKMHSAPRSVSTITRSSSSKNTVAAPITLITVLQEQLGEAVQSKRELEDKVASLGKQTKVLKKELSELRKARHEEVEKVKREPKDWLMNSTMLKDSIFQAYKDRIVNLETQISGCNSDLANAQQAIDASNSDLAKAQQAVEARNSDLANAQQSIDALQTQLNQSQPQDSNTAHEVQACQEKVAGLEGRLVLANQMYYDYEECRKEYGKLEERRAAQVQAAQQEIGALQENFAMAQRRIQELEASQSRWEIRGARAEARFHDREKEFADLQARARRLQFEFDNNPRSQPGFVTAAPNQQRHNAALQGLRENRDEFTRERDEARQERDDLRQARSEALSREMETEMKLEKAEQLITKLEKELGDRAAQINSLDHQKMFAEADLEQRRQAGPPPSAPASPRKRGREEEGEEEDGGGREKRHQDQPPDASGDPELVALFE